MKKYAIVIDSFSGVAKKEVEDEGFYYVPLQAILDDISYDDGVDFSPEEFRKKILAAKTASTSLPKLKYMEDLFEKLNYEYQNIIIMPVSSQFSNTFNVMTNLTKKYDKFYIIDNGFAGTTSFDIAKKIKVMLNKGTKLEMVIDFIKNYSSNVLSFIIPTKLDAIKKSGRFIMINKVIFGSLKLIPILIFSETKRKIISINKTLKKATIKVINKVKKTDLFKTGNYEMMIYHGGDQKAIDNVVEILKANDINLGGIFYGPAVGMINGGTDGLTLTLREKID